MDRRDGEAMASLYDPDGRFHDPAFGELTGAEARDMWRMLTGRAEDLSVELAEHAAEGDSGTARWIARYTFTRTRRPGGDDVRARVRFPGGRVAQPGGPFPFLGWGRHAPGPGGG